MDGSQLVEILSGLVDHGAWRRLIVSASSSAETYFATGQLRRQTLRAVHRRSVPHDGQGFLERFSGPRER